MSWDNRVQDAIRRYEYLSEQLADPSIFNDRDKLRDISREHSELAPVVETAKQLERVRAQLAEAREMMAAGDAEMAELAEAEVAELTSEETRLADQLRVQITPKDPLADRAAVLEIRAGTGR
jgi:peptide chain release factor 1